MGVAEVSAFLSDLTATKDAARATQQQALNALVFLYREVLHLHLAEIGAFERAKRPARLPRVPTVLRLRWSGPSALELIFWGFPRALPWATIFRPAGAGGQTGGDRRQKTGKRRRGRRNATSLPVFDFQKSFNFPAKPQL
jgi:hypothetical protein